MNWHRHQSLTYFSLGKISFLLFDSPLGFLIPINPWFLPLIFTGFPEYSVLRADFLNFIFVEESKEKKTLVWVDISARGSPFLSSILGQNRMIQLLFWPEDFSRRDSFSNFSATVGFAAILNPLQIVTMSVHYQLNLYFAQARQTRRGQSLHPTVGRGCPPCAVSSDFPWWASPESTNQIMVKNRTSHSRAHRRFLRAGARESCNKILRMVSAQRSALWGVRLLGCFGMPTLSYSLMGLCQVLWDTLESVGSGSAGVDRL